MLQVVSNFDLSGKKACCSAADKAEVNQIRHSHNISYRSTLRNSCCGSAGLRLHSCLVVS